MKGLLETKVKSKNVTKVSNNLYQGWKWYTNTLHTEKDRIWVIRRSNKFAVTVEAATSQMIHCVVIHLNTQKHFHLTFVFGFNKHELRRAL